MQQDIRDLCNDYKDDNAKLTAHHQSKFENLLQKELHDKKVERSKPFNTNWLSIAASIALFIFLASQFFPGEKPVEDTKTENQITLGKISPELNTVENYYMNSINLAISDLELNDEHKDLVDSYLIKIAELTKEYKSLTQELNTKGVNDVTIDALIRNLQLRLQLLQRLQKQLKKLNTLNTKQNEKQV